MKAIARMMAFVIALFVSFETSIGKSVGRNVRASAEYILSAPVASNFYDDGYRTSHARFASEDEPETRITTKSKQKVAAALTRDGIIGNDIPLDPGFHLPPIVRPPILLFF